MPFAITCTQCDGEGTIGDCPCLSRPRRPSFYSMAGCRICGGTGEKPCPTCNGTGEEGRPSLDSDTDE